MAEKNMVFSDNTKPKQKKKINVEIGMRLKEKRKGAGYSREKFAELTGFSSRFFAEVERGSCGLSMTSLKKCCEILGISADFLLMNKNDMEKGAEVIRKIESLNPKYIPVVEMHVCAILEAINIAENK